MCRNITKTIKNISRTHCNFLGIFARNLACTGVQISQSEVCIANKNQENLKNLRPTDSRPKPTDLMDPDQANAPGALDWSRSIRIWIKRPEIEESGSGLGQPDPNAYIKGFYTRFPSFCVTFSLSSLLLSGRSLFLRTLTLIREFYPEIQDSWLITCVSLF